MRTFSALFFASFIALSAICSQGFAFVRESSEGVFAIWPESEVTINLQVGCPDTPLMFWGPCWTDAVIDAANRWQGPDTSFRFLVRSPSVSVDACETDEFRTIAFRSTLCGGRGFGSSLAVTYFSSIQLLALSSMPIPFLTGNGHGLRILAHCKPMPQVQSFMTFTASLFMNWVTCSVSIIQTMPDRQ